MLQDHPDLLLTLSDVTLTLIREKTVNPALLRLSSSTQAQFSLLLPLYGQVSGLINLVFVKGARLRPPD
jgi:hypothetical protein